MNNLLIIIIHCQKKKKIHLEKTQKEQYLPINRFVVKLSLSAMLIKRVTEHRFDHLDHSTFGI